MPLQNRVNPDGEIVADRWRGKFMGNRGGKIHDPVTRKLTKRRWASKQWIICVTDFKQRQRMVMGNGYTELFFVDEVSALAAGHRPCFECQRKRAQNFCKLFAAANQLSSDRAGAIDTLLHEQRLKPAIELGAKELRNLPNGVIIKTMKGGFFAIYNGSALQWTGLGYKAPCSLTDEAQLVTPIATVNAIATGFEPIWHKDETSGQAYGTS